MAKQVKLQYTDNQKVILLGLVTIESDLKLSWVLNQTFGIQLSRSENAVITAKTGLDIEFSLYRYENENIHLRYSLLANKSGRSSFFEELKNIDFLFILKGEGLDNEFEKQIQSKLRQIPNITATILISTTTLKRKERLESF